jgi:hypothetical protein
MDSDRESLLQKQLLLKQILSPEEQAALKTIKAAVAKFRPRPPLFTPPTSKAWQPPGDRRQFLAARADPKTGNVQMLYAEGGEPLQDVVAGLAGIGIRHDSLEALGVPGEMLEDVRHDGRDRFAAFQKKRHSNRSVDDGRFLPDGHPRSAPPSGLFKNVPAIAGRWFTR